MLVVVHEAAEQNCFCNFTHDGCSKSSGRGSHRIQTPHGTLLSFIYLYVLLILAGQLKMDQTIMLRGGWWTASGTVFLLKLYI